MRFTHSSWRCAALFVAVSCYDGAAGAPRFNIVDFGAVGDGKTLNTESIASAVARAAQEWPKSARSEVIVPSGGRFLTGAFSLANGVVLRLEKNSTLIASTNVSQYPASGWNWDPALIDTHNATHTGIVGSGTVDGQAPGPYWAIGFDPNWSYFIPRTWQGLGGGCVGECRPKLVRFTDCTHVELAGDGPGFGPGAKPLRLHNSPDWTMLFRRCSHVVLRGLDVYGDVRWPNNDGVDFESVYNATITQCSFDTGDDGIVFSSGNTNPLRQPFRPQPPPTTELATVSDVRIRSHSSAIKFEAIFQKNHSGISRMRFQRIEIYDSSRGIGFQQRTGAGSIFDMQFSNISIETRYPTGSNWWGSGEPIWVTNLSEDPAIPDLLTGSIRDITFDNIQMHSENSVLVSGRSAHVGPITFRNASLVIDAFGNCTCSKGNRSLVPFHTGCRDYRPFNSDKDVVYGSTSGFTLEGSGSVKFGEGVSVDFRSFPGKPRPAYWAKCLNVGSGFVVDGQIEHCAGGD